MARLLRFEEHDFFTDDELDEDFSAFLSNEEDGNGYETDGEDEEAGIPFEKSEIVEMPDEIEIPRRHVEEERENSGQSLFDSLLGEALSGEEIIPRGPRVDGLFDDLEDSDGEGPEKIDRSVLEDDDSGIGLAPTEASKSESAFDLSSIETYLQYVSEEENAVSVDDVPDFASKKNVYGTCFNIRTGAIHRPPRFEFARRDSRWIDSCKELTFNSKISVRNLLTLGKLVKSVEKGAPVDFADCQFTDVHCKTSEEMEALETQHIQEIIRDAFNSRRLAVLLLGVKDGRITGCKMNPCKQDNLRLALDTAIQTEFVPPVENVLDAIDIRFLPVEGEKETHLVVIRVKQLRSQKYHLKSEESVN